MPACWLEARDRPYAYDRFGTGVPIPAIAREIYADLGDAVDRFGDPSPPTIRAASSAG